MSVVTYLQSLSVESALLLLGSVLLFALLVTLQVRNTRWVRRMESLEESMAARVRVEKLLTAVERMSSGRGKDRAASNRPVAKSSARKVPAIRTPKPSYRRAR